MSLLHSVEVWLPPLCHSLVLIGVSLLIQSTLLLLIGLAAGRALRRQGSATQRFVVQATLLGVFACCVLTVVPAGHRPALLNLSLPDARTLPALETAASHPETVVPDSVHRISRNTSPPDLSPALSTTETAANGVHIEVQPDRPTTDKQVSDNLSEFKHRAFVPQTMSLQTSRAGWFYVGIAVVWGIGALVQGIWLLLCGWGIRRIVRNSTPVLDADATAVLTSLCLRQGLRVPEMRTSTEIESIYLAGLRRPVILLPDAYTTDFDATALRAILAHEIAHIALRDTWWTWGARLLCTVCWMQPLLWLLCREREQVCEEVCDMAALTQDCSPHAYAACLVALAERLTNTRSPRLLASGVVGFRSSIGQRVEQILRGSHPIKPLSLSTRAGIGVTLAGLVAVLLFTVSATAAQEKDAWAHDARLNRKVSIAAEGIPIRDLLALLTQKTGVLLKADDYVADDKIILFTPSRPLRDILDDIAALYNDTWLAGPTQDNKNFFRLVRLRDARDYEDGLSQDMNRKMLAQMDAQIKALQETPQELARRPVSDPIRVALSTEDGRLGTSIFALLTESQRTQLMENWRTQISVALLSPAQKKPLEPLFFGDKFKPELHNGLVLDQIPREEMDKHKMRFNLIGSQGNISVYLTAPIGFNMQVSEFSAGAKFLLPPHGNPYTGKAVRDAAELPDPKAVAESQGATWIDRLHAFATKTGTPILADFYRSRPVHAADGEPNVSNDPAFQALDGLNRPNGYLWWNHGKSLLLRKRDWYSQRLYEVPDRWVETVGKRVTAHKDAITYADVLSLSDLSLDQIIGLSGSLGLHTDREMLCGVREMLASVAACPIDKETPLFKGSFGAGNALDHAVRPNLNNNGQGGLLDNFLRVFPRDLMETNRKAGGDPSEFGYLILPHDGAAVGEGSGASVQIDAMFAIHNGLSAGYILALPTMLPDDRRAKTKIDTIP
ncbi:MAG: blaR0 [Chthonomonadales bacterium]|nr:blaR0 [Chthonomonadales bacterium]